ncbi:TlpA family protein disulfide reductase [Campylobacter sp. MIT 97-5078]|uniref:TlpA family protein disulfide reductase n=1 Tax=Campylobacter sp. MIT 97-5078 TaxID=1548153 RepID=UPI000513BBD4|nr:thioredoxin fold domain-containing protein [Campylobacter sp. MIT 97-5078]KGI56116.1 thioredoxin [Campylobacter sp. MIT 97-5078]KGI57102.1 thioredoxin [Campylobacter sp. MIT 97-5078]TQR25477.1 thioredoxin [Campylobacter sp. MIT 97-5078]
MAKFARKAFVFALALFFSACFENQFKALNSNKMYEFSFDGFEKRLDFKQKQPFALVFFTKDCGVCKEQIVILKELRKLHDFDFLTILGDARDEKDALVWANEKGLDFTLFYERKASEFFSKIVGGIYGVPVIVFYNKEGFKTKEFIGLTPQNLLAKELIKLL